MRLELPALEAPAGWGFRGPLRVEYDHAARGRTIVVVLDDLEFLRPNGDRILVPRGYPFDGATIPRPARWLFGDPLDNENVRAAAVHDLLELLTRLDPSGIARFLRGIERRPDELPQLTPAGRSRYSTAEADVIFREALEASGKPRWKLRLMYAGVRAADVAGGIPLLGGLFGRLLGQGRAR